MAVVRGTRHLRDAALRRLHHPCGWYAGWENLPMPCMLRACKEPTQNA